MIILSQKNLIFDSLIQYKSFDEYHESMLTNSVRKYLAEKSHHIMWFITTKYERLLAYQ